MNDMHLVETTIGTEPIYTGRILALERLTVALPNQRTAYRDVVRHVGAAAVVPVDDEQYVYLVKQFRAPLGRVMLELPAGKLDSKGEDRLVAAKRELSEETGLMAEKWVHLTDIATTPGFSDEVIGLYLAMGLTSGDVHPDEDEFLNVVKMPFSEALDMVGRGEIDDAKTICGLLMSQHYLG